ncbi:hypothetical protein EIP91_011860 [Steccherinum ochraceum]|uniref:CUE domain-containing protein n=1 Tax=Steccherinum ochraceum TaxID=92696 RepID=A0A4R0RLL0_9APHY|nr:hypothetical protein EIP91_011860 [Steccherinum ochraceum]
MADTTQDITHPGFGAGHNEIQPNSQLNTSAAVPSTNPFSNLSSTAGAGFESHQQSALDTPQQPLPNPFSPAPQPQQQEPVPQLPPRPDHDIAQDRFQHEMAATAVQDAPRVVTPPSAPTEEHAPAEQPNAEDPPEVATLKAMFPDFDSGVLLSVLQSVDHNQDRAIDGLLGMSDPSYVSTQQPQAPTGDATDPASALLLDEQLARQLALEDEEETQRHRSRHGSDHRSGEPRAGGHTSSRRGAGNQPPQEGEKNDTQQDFTETVSRIAESGKRTFTSIVSKVKAKMSEMEQNRNAQKQGSGSQSNHPYEQYSGHPGPVDRHAVSQAVANQYYGSEGDAPPAANNPAVGGWTSPSQEVRGYDVGEPERTTAQPVSIPPPEASVTPPYTGAPASPGSGIPKPPTTGSGSPINAAKLGILPKRPVSLLGSQPNSATAPDSPSSPRREADDDDLEYMENPFEEGRK